MCACMRGRHRQGGAVGWLSAPGHSRRRARRVRASQVTCFEFAFSISTTMQCLLVSESRICMIVSLME